MILIRRGNVPSNVALKQFEIMDWDLVSPNSIGPVRSQSITNDEFGDGFSKSSQASSPEPPQA